MPDYKPVQVLLLCCTCNQPHPEAIFWNGSAWCPDCYQGERIKQQREGGQ